MQQVTTYVDDREKEFENFRKVILIQDRLSGKCPWLVLPHRRFVRESQMESMGKEYHLFLFNDILVIAKPKRECGKHRVKNIVDLAGASIAESGSPNSIVLKAKNTSESGSNYKAHKFNLSDASEAQSWKQELNKLLQDVNRSALSIDKQKELRKDYANVLTRSKPKRSPTKKSFRRSLSLTLGNKKNSAVSGK